MWIWDTLCPLELFIFTQIIQKYRKYTKNRRDSRFSMVASDYLDKCNLRQPTLTFPQNNRGEWNLYLFFPQYDLWAVTSMNKSSPSLKIPIQSQMSSSSLFNQIKSWQLFYLNKHKWAPEMSVSVFWNSGKSPSPVFLFFMLCLANGPLMSFGG